MVAVYSTLFPKVFHWISLYNHVKMSSFEGRIRIQTREEFVQGPQHCICDLPVWAAPPTAGVSLGIEPGLLLLLPPISCACCNLKQERWRKHWGEEYHVLVMSFLNEISTDQQRNLVTRVGGRCSASPTHFYSRLLGRYLEMAWTVFPTPRIFALCKE